MWLVATLLTKHTSMVNVWSQISHRLKQLPGPQKVTLYGEKAFKVVIKVK